MNRSIPVNHEAHPCEGGEPIGDCQCSREILSLETESDRPPAERGSILVAEEQVLPTLRRDGSRNWLSPSMAKGRFWHRRRWLAYSLIAFFVLLPHFRINGKPYVLLDIARREFTFLGHTFYATDTPLLASLMLVSFFSIMFITAVGGRVWCGWGCPQTVYLEFLFRPIDRFFDGTMGKGGRPKRNASGVAFVAKLLVYLIACMFLAHTFLSYFVGTDELARWMRSSPKQHPVAFLVMGGATIGLMFNFLYFREQFCMIACPYGRLQSVMLDRHSTIVSYDSLRGEPRKKGKRESASGSRCDTVVALSTEGTQSTGFRVSGDCVDCGRCTTVCPTGIDIREGLQLECIHCAQCIDACDDVMQRVGMPIGLIRYSSQDALVGNKSRWIRARTAIYPALIAVALGVFAMVLSTKFAFDARVIRLAGAPFTQFADRHVQNSFKIRLVNRSQKQQRYTIQTEDKEIEVLWTNSDAIHLLPGESVLVPLDLKFPMHKTAGVGSVQAVLQISDLDDSRRSLSVQLHGPR